MAEKAFTKTDMERVGLFKEQGYTTIGDKYRPPGSLAFNESANKGKQMLSGGIKTRTAKQDGYFNEKFNRVFESEAYSDPIKMRRQHRINEAKKNIGKPFLPSSGEKMQSGLGNHYGTLSGPIPAFSPQSKPRKSYSSPNKNFYSNPGKKGTGFGYVGVTIGSYQKHAGDPYDKVKELSRKENELHRKALKGGAFKLNMAPKAYFDENPYKGDKPQGSAKSRSDHKGDIKPFKPSSPGKVPAGMKAGTFDPYPSHSADPYKVQRIKQSQVVNKTGKIFMPSAGPKSAPIASIVNQNVIKSMNQQNYRTLSSLLTY